MTYAGFDLIHTEREGAVLTVTLTHPPLNLLDGALMPELKRLVRTLADDASVTVVVFQSGIPEFFSAHVDANYGSDPKGFMRLGEDDRGFEGLNPVQHLVASVRSLPQVTIAKLRGYLRGGGNEFAMATDLRYAAAGQTWLGQIEARMGIIPGGGGTQLLARSVGRSRALEAVLSADLYDAHTAQLYGWVTRTLPAEHLDQFVFDLARRIGSRTPAQIRAAKAALNPTTQGDRIVEDLRIEASALSNVYPSPPEAEHRMSLAVANGMQTPEAERDLEGFLDRN